MNTNNIEFWDKRVSIKDRLVTVSFNCDFGPISFSFDLDRLSEKLLKTVTEILTQFEQSEPKVFNTVANEMGLSYEEVKRNLASHITSAKKPAKLTATEEFMKGRNLPLEGSLQQLLENLPTSILLMLMHLTTAAVTLNVRED